MRTVAAHFNSLNRTLVQRYTLMLLSLMLGLFACTLISYAPLRVEADSRRHTYEDPYSASKVFAIRVMTNLKRIVTIPG